MHVYSNMDFIGDETLYRKMWTGTNTPANSEKKKKKILQPFRLCPLVASSSLDFFSFWLNDCNNGTTTIATIALVCPLQCCDEVNGEWRLAVHQIFIVSFVSRGVYVLGRADGWLAALQILCRAKEKRCTKWHDTLRQLTTFMNYAASLHCRPHFFGSSHTHTHAHSIKRGKNHTVATVDAASLVRFYEFERHTHHSSHNFLIEMNARRWLAHTFLSQSKKTFIRKYTRRVWQSSSTASSHLCSICSICWRLYGLRSHLYSVVSSLTINLLMSFASQSN